MQDNTNVGHLLKVFWWMTHPFLPKVTEAEASMVVQTLNGVLLVEDVDPSSYATSWAADILEANRGDADEPNSKALVAFTKRVERMQFLEVASLVAAAEFYLVARRNDKSIALGDFFRIG